MSVPKPSKAELEDIINQVFFDDWLLWVMIIMLSI